MTSPRKYWITLIAMLFLGMIFLVSGTGKLFMQSTAVDFQLFPGFMSGGLDRAIHAVLPYAEVAIGLLLVLGIGIRFATLTSSGLILAFLITNIVMMSRGAIVCANCFGVNGQLTIEAALLLDILMGVLVVVIFSFYRGRFFNTTPLFWQGITPVKKARYANLKKGGKQTC